MNLQQIENEMRQIHAAAGDRNFTPAQEARWAELEQARDEHLEFAKRQEEVARYAAKGYSESGDGAAGAFGAQYMKRNDPWNPSGPESASQIRSRALSAIERWNADDELKEGATATIERLQTNEDKRGVSEHLLRFSDPLYARAFSKYAADPEGYIADLTPQENAAWRSAREYQRAALGTSGAVLPAPVDPTIVLTNAGDIDPMRSVARVDSTTSKSKRYITSAGSSFSFDAELAEVSDDTFTETEKEIVTAKAQGFIQASIEVWADQPNFSSEVAKIIADGKARLEAANFVTGSGTNAPKGIQTALDGTASELSPAVAETFGADDVYAVIESLPPRFRQNGRWALELSTLNAIRRMWNPSGTEPPLLENGLLLGRPYVENSNVDPVSGVNPAATADNFLLYFGDWRNYVILDRVGMSISFLPPGILQNTANNLPDGRVGWYAYWRVGADVLTASAFRVLNVATTA